MKQILGLVALLMVMSFGCAETTTVHVHCVGCGNTTFIWVDDTTPTLCKSGCNLTIPINESNQYNVTQLVQGINDRFAKSFSYVNYTLRSVNNTISNMDLQGMFNDAQATLSGNLSVNMRNEFISLQELIDEYGNAVDLNLRLVNTTKDLEQCQKNYESECGYAGTKTRDLEDLQARNDRQFGIIIAASLVIIGLFLSLTNRWGTVKGWFGMKERKLS